MLTIPGRRFRMGDGVPRRDFVRVGSLAMGELSLSQLLQAEEAQGRIGHRALVMVYLTGGPPHQDLVDLKIHAPSEIRGKFKPIDTNVP